MEMKILFFVILTTMGGAFGAFDKATCIADYKRLLAPWATKCSYVPQSFEMNEFPLIDMTSKEGLEKARVVAIAILACGKCYVDPTALTAAKVAEVFNNAFDPNAKKAWKKDLKDWLKVNKDLVKKMDKDITKTSYILMSPEKTDTATLSAIENKCSILDERKKSDFSYETADDKKNKKSFEKMQEIVACGDAPMSPITLDSAPAPGSMIVSASAPGGGGAAAPGSDLIPMGDAPGSFIF